MATAMQLHDRDPPLDTLDVSLARWWREDRALALLARLRAEEPIHYCPESPFGPYWSVTRHADVAHIELRPSVFSSSYVYGGITIFGEHTSPPDERLPMFIAMDRPRHGGPRRTVAPALGPASVAELAPSLRVRTEQIVDALPIGERFDWVDRVSIELTTQMLAILFDFPWEDRRLLTRWSDWAADIEAARDPRLGLRRTKILWECGRYFLELRRQRRAAGAASDLLSRIFHSPVMDGISPRELLGHLVLLIIGGNDTTRNTISALPIVNCRFPEEWPRIAARPAMIVNAAQELIRWQTPLAHMRRTATRDFELRGKIIRAGDKVVLWYLSANRDEAAFPDADSFVADRPNARRHLAFGAGIHRCVGARLAQLQVATLMDVLVERGLVPVQVGKPQRVGSSFVNGYRRLPVELRPLRCWRRRGGMP